MTLTDKLSHLRAINIRTLFDDILRENEKDIVDFNRDQMYEEGIMNVKTKKKERYSPATIRAKKKAPFNKTEFITLKWMGKFHDSLRLLIFKDYFVVSSDNTIWANYIETQERFGKALGLTKESQESLKEIVRDEMIKKIRNVL